MLAEEFGTASNIKSRVNRQSVLGAITSTQQRLKLYNKVPPNGLVVYCGDIITSEGKERKINIDFEPFKPINTSLYLCDNKFHVEALSELLESDQKFGFIIMDGNGALLLIYQKSMGVVASPPSVSLDFERRNVTTTSAKWQNLPCRTSSRTTRSM
jgi:peptide subunit release factor 1 (eRF1)